MSFRQRYLVLIAAIAAAPAAAQPVCPVFDEPQQLALGSAGDAVLVSDVNADDHQDIVVLKSYSREILVFFGDGDGTFTLPRTSPRVAKHIPRSLSAADVDKDGHLDLVLVDAWDHTVHVLRGSGHGGFASTANFPVFEADRAHTADVDGDGNADLIVTCSSVDEVAVLLGRGDLTFEPEQRLRVGDTPVGVAVGDLNGDGHGDLAVVNNMSSDISILLGRGDGTFEPEHRVVAGNRPRCVLLTDMNGDDALDLITVNYLGANVSVLLGNGDGSSQKQKLYSAGNGATHGAAADFDGDGLLDIVIANLHGPSLSLLRGAGDGTLGAPLAFTAGSAPLFVATADFDADGGADVAVLNKDATDMSVLLNYLSDCCPADCDRDMEATFFDFLCFQNLFAAGDPRADCDGDTQFTFSTSCASRTPLPRAVRSRGRRV